MTIGNACAAGQLAIDVACRKLFYDAEIDSAIVCSYDLIATTVFAGFKSINTLAPEFCRPFVVSDGMSLGEAVGCMLVKRDRGKFNICLSQINNDAYHLTSPEPTGKQKIELLESAKRLIGTKSVFVNIHGTGTAKNDISERNALTKVFPNVDVDATKCFTGHCLGASGFAECMFVMQRLVEQPSYEYGISMNFAFGGTNSCIVLSKSNSHEFIANRHDSISSSKSTYGHSRLS